MIPCFPCSLMSYTRNAGRRNRNLEGALTLLSPLQLLLAGPGRGFQGGRLDWVLVGIQALFAVRTRSVEGEDWLPEPEERHAQVPITTRRTCSGIHIATKRSQCFDWYHFVKRECVCSFATLRATPDDAEQAREWLSIEGPFRSMEV